MPFVLLLACFSGCGQSRTVRIEGITLLKDKQQIQWAEYILSAPYGWQQKERAEELFSEHSDKAVPAILEALRFREACFIQMARAKTRRIHKIDEHYANLLDDYLTFQSAAIQISYRTPKINLRHLESFLLATETVQNLSWRVATYSSFEDDWGKVIWALERQSKSNQEIVKALTERYGQKSAESTESTSISNSEKETPTKPAD